MKKLFASNEIQLHNIERLLFGHNLKETVINLLLVKSLKFEPLKSRL